MLKRFLKVLLLLVCTSGPGCLHAKVITPQEAAKVATDFFSAGNVSRLSSIDALELVRTSKKVTGLLFIMFLMLGTVVALLLYRLTIKLFRLWGTLMRLPSWLIRFPMSLTQCLIRL